MYVYVCVYECSGYNFSNLNQTEDLGGGGRSVGK